MEVVEIMFVITVVVFSWCVIYVLAFDKGFHKGFEEGQKSIKNKMADYVNKKF